MAKLTSIEIKDFLLDEKSIVRTNYCENVDIESNFKFELIKIFENEIDHNTLFSTKLEIKFTDKDQPEKIVATILLKTQVVTFIAGLENIDVENPDEETLKFIRETLYPATRSLVFNDLPYIKRNISDIPYLM